MSTAGPPPSEPDALASQVEAVQREAQALAAAQSSARLVRLALLAALAVFVLVVCTAFYRLGSRIVSRENLEAVTKEAQERLAKNPDLYMKHVTRLVDNTSPAVTGAVAEQVKKDMPEYIQAAEKQRDQLAENLRTQLMKKLDERYEKLLAKHQELLKKEFKQAENPETQQRMVANLRRAVDKLAQKYYADEMQRQMQELYAQWDNFPAAPEPRKGEEPASTQFVASMMDMLTHKLSHPAAAQP